jgi:hypothetical protein
MLPVLLPILLPMLPVLLPILLPTFALNMNNGVTSFILKYRWQINYGTNNQACVLSYSSNRPLYAFMLMGSAVSLVDAATR